MGLRLVPRRVRSWWARRTAPPALPEGGRLSFSTHGEDLVTRELLMRAGKLVDVGFYVDVGAFHPWLFSNTAAWYREGWSGIAVEPNPVMAQLLRTERPRDTVVEAAVAAESGTATLYSFGAWASSNTLDREWADSVAATQHIEVEEEIEVRTVTLAALLDEYLPPATEIHLLNVDVEGLDLVALQSNDWDRYRPVVVAIEEYEMDLASPSSSPVFRLMKSCGYRLMARTVLTNFYLREG